MELDRDRMKEDLRGIVSGDVLCDDASRAIYATDGSLFEVWPLAIVRPRSIEDISATVRWAAEERVSIHARGAGSSVAGLALGAGIVLDCSSYLRRIVSTEDATVRVQAGVTSASLEEHLSQFGRLFGPDPANRGVTTIGGMIGRNTSGSRFARVGDVRSRLISAQVVLGDGSIVEVEPTVPRFSTPDNVTPDRMANLAAGVESILTSSHETISAAFPENRCLHGGYRLDGLRQDGAIDLPKLFAGAEGTLGIITEATLQTFQHTDETSSVGLFLFDSLEKAAEAALRLRQLQPSTCDLFDKRHLSLARRAKIAFDLLIPPAADAGLLVEFCGLDAKACQSQLDDAIRRVQGGRWGSGPLAIDVRRAEDAVDVPIFVLIFLGFITGRICKVDKKSIKVMSDLILFILVPSLVFTSALKISSSTIIWSIVFSAIFIILMVGIIAYIIAKLIRLENSSKNGFLLTTMFMNAGSMASSVCFLFYGPEGFILAISFFITTQTLLYTLGVFIASSNGKKFDLSSLKIVFTMPLIYALLAGFILSYFGITVPGSVLRPIELLSIAAVPLLLLSLGMQVSLIKFDLFKLKTPALSTAVRIGFGFVLGLTFTRLIGITGVAQGVVIIASAMPTKITTFPIANRFKADPEHVSLSIMLSTLLSLITLPFILLFLSS